MPRSKKSATPTSRKGKARTPPFNEWPEWSDAKFFSFLRSGLRAKWSRWPAKYAVLAAAKRNYEGPKKQQKFEYLCATCGAYHPQKNVSVDHITPAGTLRTFEDLPDFCRKLFVGVDKLQVLCDECHKVKTAQDKEKNND